MLQIVLATSSKKLNAGGGAAAAKKLPKTVAILFSGVCEEWSEKASPSRAVLRGALIQGYNNRLIQG
jgi:hypothetical protein